MDKARVACIGAGYFSQFHYQSWNRLELVEPVASCDKDLQKAKATGLPAFDDLHQMLNRANPDLVDVILPPSQQKEVIENLIKAGIKIIICQKPFCRNLEDARDVISKALAANVTLVVHENFRFQPWYRLIKSYMDAGKIGEVMQVTFRLRPGDGQGKNAYLLRQPYFRTMDRFLVRETAIHWVDTFRYLLGEPTAVYADLRKLNPNIKGEDAGYILFDFEDGKRALLDGNRHLDHPARNTRGTMGEALAEGTKGSIYLKGDGFLSMRRFGKKEEEFLLHADHSGQFGGDCVHHFQDHVIKGILDGGILENQAADYFRNLEIEEAIYQSAKEQTKISLL